MTKHPPLAITKPTISEKQLQAIRAAARRYILAGNPLFGDSENGSDRDDMIDALRAQLHPEADTPGLRKEESYPREIVAPRGAEVELLLVHQDEAVVCVCQPATCVSSGP